jgi:hypothetical protein
MSSLIHHCSHLTEGENALITLSAHAEVRLNSTRYWLNAITETMADPNLSDSVKASLAARFARRAAEGVGHTTDAINTALAASPLAARVNLQPRASLDGLTLSDLLPDKE